MARWKFIGNGRIKDETLGTVWFIYGFQTEYDDLTPLNLRDRGESDIRTRDFLKILRFPNGIDFNDQPYKLQNYDVMRGIIAFQQIEYFGKDHPLAGQIKSIIF